MNVLENKLIQDEELLRYGSVSNLSEKAISLVKQQQATWKIAQKNFRALSGVQTRNLDFGHFHVKLQHNPGRIRSSTARTDAKSLSERPCFLCINSTQPEQKGILLRDKFLIFANPYPIFPVHLTIPSLAHIPQRISGFFPDMVDLSKELKDFILFYNGPECGASAPDHFHFQAGNKGFLPVESELDLLESDHSKTLFQDEELKVFVVNDYLRRLAVIKSKNRELAVKTFQSLFNRLPFFGDDEPMVNILCWFTAGIWHILIFPRSQQRSSHFFRKGDGQILISPATVELSGVVIVPRERDFLSVSPRIIEEIFAEVTLHETAYQQWLNSLSGLSFKKP
jgi:hypothetical protein